MPAMRLPKKSEMIAWQLLWGRNPVTLALVGLLPAGRVDRPIFIVGSPRSGTSVFSRLFGQHPQLANWSEGHCLFDPGYVFRGGEHRWTAEKSTWFGRRRLRSNVHWFSRYIAARQGIRDVRFTNKLPRNTLRIPWLLEAFPDARFVHIIRDGRAVVRSMIRVVERQNKHDRILGSFARPEGWQEYHQADPYEAHSRQWTGIEETVMKDLEAVPDERIYRTRYEEFIVRTRAIMREICVQFDLAHDEASLSIWPEHLENRNVKWPEECTTEQIETMRRWLTPTLIAYGYESREDWPVPDRANDAAGPTSPASSSSSSEPAPTAGG